MGLFLIANILSNLTFFLSYRSSGFSSESSVLLPFLMMFCKKKKKKVLGNLEIINYDLFPFVIDHQVLL